MSKKPFVKVVSVVLSLLILLTVLPLGVSATDTAAVTPEAGNVTEKITETTTGQRVRAEEGDSLYTIVTDNGDGTHTMTLYDHPVKFIDAKGKLQDISLEITTAENGAYKTKANEIQTVFPNKISDGITLSGKGVSVKLTPDRGTHSSPTAPTIGTITADVTVTKIDNETVSYYYDNKTTFEYSLTYTGFKEDIVVAEYTGQTEYHFLLETGGLTLTKIDESYYLTDENGEIKATLGDIIIFTADERNNALGSMTHETVKENEQYIITIHVDAEYLKDEKTKYPIRIDPTIEITYDSNGSGAIQDVTLNQNSGSSGSSGSIYVGKRNTYGISRTLMKFPGLNLGAIPSANNLISAHVEIRDMLCETTSMTVYGCAFGGSVWSDSTANWSNANPEIYMDLTNSYANVSYSNGNAKNPKHRYSIDITQAIRYWKNGSTVYTKDTGIMLKASYEVENGSSALYKTFASYNRSSNKPSLKVNYRKNAALVGIPDTGHDHSTVFTNISSDLQSMELIGNIYNGNSTQNTIKSYLDNNNNSVFVSRSHGSYYTQNWLGTETLVCTYIILNNSTDELLSSNDMASLELSNLRLAVFVGCHTGKGGEGAENLPTVTVEKGAEVAIGFEDIIYCTDANNWTKWLFYYLSRGYTVEGACNYIKDYIVGWEDDATIDQVIICGNKQATF